MQDHSPRPIFRAPSVSNVPPNPDFVIPPLDFLNGTWHVTHSTLPMWKSKRNVRITYTSLSDAPDKLDDLVEYQSPTSDKLKTIHGLDTPNPAFPASWDWRGKGWLKIAGSHWEVLGYGVEDGGWAVTYFAKTLFTPAGIDIYSREKGGLSEGLVQTIRDGLTKIEDDNFRKLLEGIFAVKHD